LLERVEPPLRRDRLVLVHTHPVDNPLVLLGDPLHELGPLEEIGETVGLQDHGHDIGLIGLVALHQTVGKRGSGLGQACPKPDEPDAAGSAGACPRSGSTAAHLPTRPARRTELRQSPR